MRIYLEKVVFEEVPEWLVGWNGPPCVVVKIQGGQKQDQCEGRQLGFVADRNEYHENRAEDVLDDLQHGQLEAQQRDEHESEQYSAGKLQEVLRLVLAEGRDAGEQAATLNARLGQHEQESADQREVAKQKVKIPENGVGDCLRKRNGKTASG